MSQTEKQTQTLVYTFRTKAGKTCRVYELSDGSVESIISEPKTISELKPKESDRFLVEVKCLENTPSGAIWASICTGGTLVIHPGAAAIKLKDGETIDDYRK